jgi:hypothetical protein
VLEGHSNALHLEIHYVRRPNGRFSGYFGPDLGIYVLGVVGLLRSKSSGIDARARKRPFQAISKDSRVEGKRKWTC